MLFQINIQILKLKYESLYIWLSSSLLWAKFIKINAAYVRDGDDCFGNVCNILLPKGNYAIIHHYFHVDVNSPRVVEGECTLLQILRSVP